MNTHTRRFYTGMRNSFEVEHDLFTQASFKDAIKKTFVAAGQTPRPDGSFTVYKTHARSSISACLLPASRAEEQCTLATITGGADVAPCEDDDEPATDDEPEDETE